LFFKCDRLNDKYGIIIPVLATVAFPFIFTYISLNFSSIKDLASLGIFFTIAIGFLTYFWNKRTKTDDETTSAAIIFRFAILGFPNF
jgi:RsiW-degrading membrane proteinase PrsW (M82 family)